MTKLQLLDDGTLKVESGKIMVPPFWVASDMPGVYRCLLPACRRRRFSYRCIGDQLTVRIHCRLYQRDCTGEECQGCTRASAATGVQREMEIVELNGTVTKLMVTEMPPDTELPPKDWTVEHPQEPLAPRPDLIAIERSLPETKDHVRKVRFELDGTIIYEPEEGDWEPPKDINGYKRDPDNPWRFIPLWPKCMKRTPKATRTKACGCIRLTMVCDNPASELHTKHVTDAECQQCQARVT